MYSIKNIYVHPKSPWKNLTLVAVSTWRVSTALSLPSLVMEEEMELVGRRIAAEVQENWGWSSLGGSLARRLGCFLPGRQYTLKYLSFPLIWVKKMSKMWSHTVQGSPRFSQLCWLSSCPHHQLRHCSKVKGFYDDWWCIGLGTRASYHLDAYSSKVKPGKN